MGSSNYELPLEGDLACGVSETKRLLGRFLRGTFFAKKLEEL